MNNSWQIYANSCLEKLPIMKRYNLLFLLFGLLLTACIRDLADEGIYKQTTIRGTVAEQQSQQPIAGIYARLVLNGQTLQTATTNEEGCFLLPVEYDQINKGCSVEVYADSLYESATIALESKGYGKEFYEVGTIFVVGPELPTVSTADEVTDITATSAHCAGTVTATGKSAVVRRGVVWSKLQYPTIQNAYSVNGGGMGDFTAAMENLEVGTTYYVRAYATNGVGTAYGEQRVFTTLSGLPVMTQSMAEITAISATSARSGGEVSADGGFPVTARGVCWSTSPDPTIANTHTTDGNGTGTFVSMLTSLSPSTHYYVRAYATNQNGTVYSLPQQFTTLSGLPVIASPSATPTSISSTSAVITSEITSDGGFSVSARGVCYSTTPNPTISSPHTTDGNGIGSFTSHLTNLTPSTTYYYRAYATNATGTTYSQERTFSTSAH